MEMIEHCTSCIERDPQNPKYYLKRGLAMAYHKNSYKQAQEDLQRAHDLDNKDPVIINELKTITEKIEQDDAVEVKEL